MTGTNVLDAHPPEFERFLYASVGEDRNGYVVTVLSMLARLGLDPWTETSELVALGRSAARTRLGDLLSKLRDVPALDLDYRAVARDLILLLPETASSQPEKQSPLSGVARLGSRGTVWAILAIVFVVVQVLSNGVLGWSE